MLKNKVGKLVVILSVCSCFLISVALAIYIAPKLLSVSVENFVGHSYPDYSFNQLAEVASKIEHCVLIQVESPKKTANDTGSETITTDYVFRSKEKSSDIFVVRLNGGSVGNRTVYNTDNIDQMLRVGNEYVLFLNNAQQMKDPITYQVSDQDTIIGAYYTLLIGKGSIFNIDSNAVSQNTIVCSTDLKYQISCSELIELSFAK